MLPPEIKIMLVAGFRPITQDVEANTMLYRDVMGLPLKSFQNTPYYIIDDGIVDGVKHFAMWPLSMAAQSCFKSEQWPDHLPIPQAWLEFDVDDLEVATECLKRNDIILLLIIMKSHGDNLLPVFWILKVF